MFGFRRKYKCILNYRVLADSGRGSRDHYTLINPINEWMQRNGIECDHNPWEPEKLAFYKEEDLVSFKLTFPEAILELS